MGFKAALMRKISNKIPVSGWELRLLKKQVEENFLHMGIEPTNMCNASCTFCGYRFLKRKKEIISNEVFLKALEQYDRVGGGDLGLTPTVGDSLLDPQLVKGIKLARKFKNIRRIFFYTNLIALEKHDLKGLLLSGLSNLTVSTCIGDAGMFKRLYRVDKYDTVMKNLENMLVLNNQLGKPIEICISLRLEKPYSRVFETPDYQRIAKLCGEKNIRDLENRVDNWTGLIKEDDLPAGEKFTLNPGEKKEPCFELYRRITVHANGDVSTCVCRDLNVELKIGNILEEPLETIWHGGKLEKFRKNWEKGKVPRVCRDCYYYKPISQWLEKYRLNIWALLLRRFFINHNLIA